jgi:hydroxylamine dehydrogenase
MRRSRRGRWGVFLILLGLAAAAPHAARADDAGTASVAALSPESQRCVVCHVAMQVGIYQEWFGSRHHRAGVGCYECHRADAKDADAFEHNGFTISVIVSPKDCARCHANEVREFTESHHAKAARILGSLDNVLAEVVEGNRGFVTPAFPAGVSAAAVNGCWQCHGSEVRVLKDAKGRPTGNLDPATWPNTGIGRINPDGSEGSCTACHQRHRFSLAQAREPENCGKCHMGPDHPQIEIYNESKHGISFRSNRERMNLDSRKWVVGEDYSAAPTCATCHMSATRDLPVTHNVGLRIKWNNRPVHPTPADQTDRTLGLPSASVSGDQRRADMEKVCQACHASDFTGNFFLQYEGLLSLYDQKFAVPGEKLYQAATAVLKRAKGPAYAQFAQKIDFVWFELWHHEGRRARHAASMQGPDYTHWHGTYELARNFYGDFIPELEEIAKANAQGPAAQEAADLARLLDEVLSSDDHRWYLGRLTPEERADRERRRQEFQERYK